MASADTTAVTPSANGSADAGGGERPGIAVENPATGEVVAHVPDRSPEEVRAMVARARAAQPGWEAIGFAGRAQVMRRMQKWMLDHIEEVINTIQSETGKTYEDAFAAEVSYGAAAFGFWADESEKYLAPEKIKAGSPMLMGRRMELRFRPLGVIGVIGPWNYPFTNSIGDSIPALMAGNTVVLKPSEVTPLTSLLIEKAMRDCGMPEDVLIVATGRGDTGAALIDEVDMIMFTGSTATGKKVMAKASETLTPVSLELGGKDPMIVLADANIERAANAAVVLLDVQRRADLHQHRARLRRGARVRRVRREGRREDEGAAPGRPVRRGRLGRRRRDHVPQPDGDHRAPRPRRDRQGRPRADRWPPGQRARACSSSRRSSSTSTTRWRR